MNLLQFIQQIFIWNAYQNRPESKFVDLAPTSNADETGIYYEALAYATSNDEVLNIALTGPYGSGKSSVIKSFLLKYPGKALQLSLASFLPDGEVPGVRVSKQEIERSILQQILYGADADKLPLSRFKRIQTPEKWSAAKSLWISLGIFCAWYIFYRQSDIATGTFFKPFEVSNWFNIVCFAVVAVFLWRIIHSIYLKSFGLSLKSISLKDVQIAPDAADAESILNRHLDEIIYFFQSTEYDLVVIEDLDRFENPDIFVTLREINGLINENAGIRRRIRFLYALRDDIFVNTDRTKFFEFIVPVVPVINHSNSIDKVLEQGQRIDLETKLDRGFIRDVSRYLSDLRLIRNIFNEYVIYSSNLKSDTDDVLDPNKLLAVLIYKNVIPKDFAALHRQEGALSRVLINYDRYIQKIETRIRVETAAIEADLAIGEAQALRDYSELCRVYAMALIERMPANSIYIVFENNSIGLGQISQHADFERILSGSSIKIEHANGHRNGLDIRGVEPAVDPTRTFAERKAAIEKKSANFQEEAERKIGELKGQLATLRTRKFNEVVRESAELIDEIFAEVGDSRDLLKFLILEGYLDDTYYQYISLFHSGRLSPNDNKFLIQIRSYQNPDPDFQIDNAAEVIASMREEDFRRSYVLNRFIIDHLLEDSSKYATHIVAACEFIASHFDDSEDFLLSYYDRGTYVDRLVSALASKWSAFPEETLAAKHSATHAARITAFAPERKLRSPYYSRTLGRYLSLNTFQVLNQGVDIDLARLKALAVRVADVNSIGAYATTVSFIAAEGLYKISISNIYHIMKHVVGWPATEGLETRNFTTLLEANDNALLKRIDSDFETYVREVLLKLEQNMDEDPLATIKVLGRDDVEMELREEFLRRQTATFSSLEPIPSAFHPLILERRVVESTWDNCLKFLASEAYRPELLTAYLQDIETAEELTQTPVPRGDGAAALRKFLFENDDLTVDVYRSYIRAIPNNFNTFPSVTSSTLKVLIEERKVNFTSKNFADLEDQDLKVLFIAVNFEAYLTEPDTYTVDDAFRQKLLASKITDPQKMKVIADIDPAFVSNNASIASSIGPILDRSTLSKSDFGPEFVRAVILNTKSDRIQISLLNKLHDLLSVPEVRDVLRGLPEPYREIAAYGKFPRIEKNESNELLVSWLKERNLISSYAPTLLGDAIRINTFRKEP